MHVFRDAKCASHLSVINVSHTLLWKLHFPGSLAPWLPGREGREPKGGFEGRLGDGRCEKPGYFSLTSTASDYIISVISAFTGKPLTTNSSFQQMNPDAGPGNHFSFC